MVKPLTTDREPQASSFLFYNISVDTSFIQLPFPFLLKVRLVGGQA